MSAPSASLVERAGAVCELCGAASGLVAYPVPPHADAHDDHCALVCATCHAQIEGSDLDGTPLDATHWFCLQESAWSQVAPVQVLAWRLLDRLDADWARDLRGQLYLPEDVAAWAAEGGAHTASGEAGGPTVDSNGTPLADGDSVTLIKDLVVKGANFTAKRGTMVRGIRLTDDPQHVEGKVNKVSIVLKTQFLRRA